MGGADNVKEVTHCFTRLRFVLKDERIPKDEEVSRAEGVISVVRAGGQYQVVCGTRCRGFTRNWKIYWRRAVGGGGRNYFVARCYPRSTQARPRSDLRRPPAPTFEARPPLRPRSASPLSTPGAAPTSPTPHRGSDSAESGGDFSRPWDPGHRGVGADQGLLTAARLLLELCDVDLAATDTYVILNPASQVIFLFMPISWQ